MLHKLRRHAVSGVGHGDAEGCMSDYRAGKLLQLQRDGSAVGRILDRVRQQVDKNLSEAHAVGNQHLMRDFVRADDKRLLTLLRLLANDVVYLLHQLREADGFPVQLHAAGLDSAHIQNIVNQSQQIST